MVIRWQMPACPASSSTHQASHQMRRIYTNASCVSSLPTARPRSSAICMLVTSMHASFAATYAVTRHTARLSSMPTRRSTPIRTPPCSSAVNVLMLQNSAQTLIDTWFSMAVINQTSQYCTVPCVCTCSQLCSRIHTVCILPEVSLVCSHINHMFLSYNFHHKMIFIMKC